MKKLIILFMLSILFISCESDYKSTSVGNIEGTKVQIDSSQWRNVMIKVADHDTKLLIYDNNQIKTIYIVDKPTTVLLIFVMLILIVLLGIVALND